MIPEIKFRLIRDGEVVGYEEHKIVHGVLGIYHRKPSGQLFGYGYSHNIKHDQKEQFIGVLDKENNELFVGDIIKDMNV